MLKNIHTFQPERLTFFRSIRGRLLLFFLALSLIPMLSLSVLAYLQGQSALHERVDEEFTRLIKIESTNIEQWLIDRTADLNVIAGAARVKTMQPDQAKAAIDLYYKEWKIYETIFVVGKDGKSIASSDNQAYDLSGRDYIQRALKGEIIISQPVVSKATGHVIISIAAPILVNNLIVGAAGATVPTSYISQLLFGALMGETGDAYLINQDGFFITPSRFEDELKAAGKIQNQTAFELKIDTLASQKTLSGIDGMSEYMGYRGIPVMGAYHWIPGQKWGLIIEQESSETFAAINSLRTVLILVSILAAFAVIVSAVLIARGIANPIISIAGVAQEMARGKIRQNIQVKTRDEIGELGAAFQEMIAYQQEMAACADQLADGNLTVDLQPKSKDDILGEAFVRMITQLRGAIRQVAVNARALNDASVELASTSNQASQVTAQISTTIQQVAAGTTQQSEATGQSANSMEQLTRAIGSVAQGAQAQAEAVTRMARLTELLNSRLQQVSGNTNSVSLEAENARMAAREGRDTVNNTVQVMDSIRSRVGLTSSKVQEMGARSDEIGVILEAIDDIATQTNLLALNAAIEAARAGEHGRGFAVVADEVRKLAERASSSTKEISKLIQGIQGTVSEAVEAMNKSTLEVENGASRAQDAGKALDNILKAAESVREQAGQAADSVAQMEKVSNDLIAAAGQVSSIIEKNAAATQEMSAGSDEIERAIENIASVSEENSAAVEEVSASAEEMSAQVEEVTASAQELAHMALRLQETVDQFQLPHEVLEGAAAPCSNDASAVGELARSGRAILSYEAGLN